jgi:TFIIF-interacting CTD phosphatase-like protein
MSLKTRIIVECDEALLEHVFRAQKREEITYFEFNVYYLYENKYGGC